MIYIVQPGDTVEEIGKVTGADLEDLIYDNQLVAPYQLAVGQTLYIRQPKDENIPGITANGYAYPFISPWVLRQTLPFLSELSIFSYGFTMWGELIPPWKEETLLIEAAHEYGAKAILTLTPLGADGQFNNTLISAVVQDLKVQQYLQSQLLAVMKEKAYDGLDIDFEYIKAEDRDAFTEFVRSTTEVLNAYGYQVSVALAPKTRDDQPGLLYEGKDYRALGNAANHVLLMTYEYGYKYSEPQAVAPINQVRRVVEYAVTRILPEKISLGIPNYGYDWPLPYVKGVTAAKTIGNIEAVRIAITQGVPILFEESSQSPYFTYTENGIDHEVWFEDLRSLQRKFDLIQEFGLRGPGYWQIMQLYRANWLLLNLNFEIGKGTIFSRNMQ